MEKNYIKNSQKWDKKREKKLFLWALLLKYKKKKNHNIKTFPCAVMRRDDGNIFKLWLQDTG